MRTQRRWCPYDVSGTSSAPVLLGLGSCRASATNSVYTTYMRSWNGLHEALGVTILVPAAQAMRLLSTRTSESMSGP
jgi:hypothetical protein